jgi:hypothetical protein
VPLNVDRTPCDVARPTPGVHTPNRQNQKNLGVLAPWRSWRGISEERR